MYTDPLIGKRIGHYVVEELLGQGGLARVYRARHRTLRTYAALKIVESIFEADPEYTERFRREAHNIFQLRHPHIVRFYEFGALDDLYYLAVEYVDGPDLGRVLEDYRLHGELIPQVEAFRIIEQAAQALDYIHACGLVHRDLKPSNLLLDRHGRVVLTDFDMALNRSEKAASAAFGSAHYIAPEQADNAANALPQSDLYALGVILYEMLTGRLPFDGDTPMAIALKHIAEAPPPPHSVNPNLPPALEAIVLRSLDKKAAARYQTGAALVAALHQAIEQERVEGPSGSALGAQPAVDQENHTRTESPNRSSAPRPLVEVVSRKRNDLSPRAWLALRQELRWPLRLLLSLGGVLFIAILVALPVIASIRSAALLKQWTQPDLTTGALAPLAPPPNLQIIYDDVTATVINISDGPVSLAGTLFKRVADDGTYTAGFSAGIWDQVGAWPTRALPPGDCYQVKRTSSPVARSAACAAVQGWVATSNQARHFWIAAEGNAAFQVTQNDQVIHTCIIAEGECTLHLPQP